ncbi:hypothetical protein HI914_07329 [Erysiphe necator]|nr:hypothetical protein HI914_07329 [Erysiphe necator]
MKSILKNISQNGRHTSQAWRARWTKYVSSNPPRGISEMDRENHIWPCENIEHNANSTRSKNPNLVNEINPISYENQQNEVVDSLISQITCQDRTDDPKQNVFTDSEINQLFDAYSEILSAPEEKKSEAWTSWAKLNPTHKAEEWKTQFYEYVMPRQEALIAKYQRMRKRSYATERYQFPSVMQPSTKNVLKETEIEVRSPQSIKSLEQLAGNPNELSEDNVFFSEVQVLLSDHMLHNEDFFKQSLQYLADELGLEVNFNPQIGEREIPLMKLWKTVQSLEFGGSKEMKVDNDWQRLAKSLGFIDHITMVAQELKDCYNEILADLEHLRHEFLMEMPFSSMQKKVLIEKLPQFISHQSSDDYTDSEIMDNLPRETQFLCNDSIDLDTPRTPEEPQKLGKKRSLDLVSSHKKFIPNKRQRISDGKNKVLEIPSTPESIINFNQNSYLNQENSLELINLSQNFNEIEVLSPSPSNFRLDTRKSISNKSISPPVMKPEKQSNCYAGIDQIFDSRSNSKSLDTTEIDQKFRSHGEKRKKKPSAANSVQIVRDSIENSTEKSFSLHDGISSYTIKKKLSALSLSENESRENSPCPEKGDKRIVDQNISSLTLQEEGELQAHKEEKSKLDEFVENQIVLGFSIKTIIRALEATSMAIGPTSHIDTVLKTIEQTDCIPEDLPGVWTTSDDELLKQAILSLSSSSSYTDSKIMKPLYRKHGEINVQLRQDYWRFMEILNQEQMITTDDGS